MASRFVNADDKGLTEAEFSSSTYPLTFARGKNAESKEVRTEEMSEFEAKKHESC